MENSPNPLKRNTRLTLNSKHRLSDSPKTPIRKKIAPNDGFETPPSLSRINSDHYLGEESPSQDYDYSSIPMSQDMIKHYRDVTWKWNDDNDSQQNKSKLIKEFRPPIMQKIEKSSAILETKNKIDKTKGFYKFQELLLAEGGNLKKLLNKNRKNNGEITEKLESKYEKTEKLESSCKENIITISGESNICGTKVDIKSETKGENKVAHNKLRSKLPFNEIEKTSLLNVTVANPKRNDIDFLNDSDSDSLLFELTQKVESNIQSTKSSTSEESEGSLFVNIGKRKSNLSHIKKMSNFDNDSIDELMLSLPMDEQIKINNNKILPNNCDIKSSFSRHNSMPPQNSPNNSTNTLLRYSSANCIRTKMKISPKSVNGDGKISPFSEGSLESVHTTASDHMLLSKKCTKAEVEKKRQEAKLRRLQSQMRREITQKSQQKQNNKMH